LRWQSKLGIIWKEWPSKKKKTDHFKREILPILRSKLHEEHKDIKDRLFVEQQRKLQQNL